MLVVLTPSEFHTILSCAQMEGLMSVAWLVRAFVIVVAVAVSGSARAGTMQTLDGYTYNGVVEQTTDTGVKFLWEKERDQADEIIKMKADRLFEAKGSRIEMRDIPYTSIARIEGVPVDRFPMLFQYNLFFRTIQELDAGRIRVASSGDFIRQVKSAGVLLLSLGVLVPLLLVLVASLLPGERLTFLGGLVFAFLFTLVGMAMSLASAMLTSAIPAMASGGAQIGLTVAIALFLSGATHMSTRHSLWQGLGFTLVWGASLFLAGRLAARLAGVGDLGV